MSVPHSGNPERPDQSDLLKQFQEQLRGHCKREWPEGRLSGDDDGQAVYMIGSDPDKQVVVIDFGKPTKWIGMPPQDAVDLAQLLIKHARAISSEPISVSIG